ncbi:hypothetical protein, partial [Actinomadura darangshiensis]|uniref:hypothetical protein n=1 Tax=Actinomadura darangshiensis TaxID=705336 RepID=UPI001A9F954B
PHPHPTPIHLTYCDVLEESGEPSVRPNPPLPAAFVLAGYADLVGTPIGNIISTSMPNPRLDRF